MKAETLCREPHCDDYATERPRFFPRQLITPDDLNLVLEHYRTKLRRHNRLLHGWGVVCGAKVCPIPKLDGGIEAWKVKVTMGYILGPYGDEILIDCERTVDLRTSGVTGVTGEPCVEAPDPWCSEVFVPCEENGSRFLAVKYKEIMTRPVRVQPVGCGCDETQCEYSRWRDGYEIKILNECPESHQHPPMPKPEFEDLHDGSLRECPPCPKEPWVVLAKIELGDDGAIKKIDNCSCRRLVISFGHFWWQCKVELITITGLTSNNKTHNATTPISVNAGDADRKIEVTGTNLMDGVKVEFGSGVTVKVIEVTGSELTATIAIAPDAAGSRSMTVINPDCSSATLPNAIEILGQNQDAATGHVSTKKGRR
ncbi:MAG: hypothetical protein ACREV1_01045 [Gammaproteobacteria bacterium]